MLCSFVFRVIGTLRKVGDGICWLENMDWWATQQGSVGCIVHNQFRFRLRTHVWRRHFQRHATRFITWGTRCFNQIKVVFGYAKLCLDMQFFLSNWKCFLASMVALCRCSHVLRSDHGKPRRLSWKFSMVLLETQVFEVRQIESHQFAVNFMTGFRLLSCYYGNEVCICNKNSATCR